MTKQFLKSIKFSKFEWKEPKFPRSDSATAMDRYSRALEKRPELKPGQVLLMKDGVYILVGDVNKYMGVCDDCTNYEMKDIRKIATIPGFEE